MRASHLLAALRRLGAQALLALVAVVLGQHAGSHAAEPSPPPIRIALIEGLSGPFANAGEAVFRNLLWATERVNARGGVALPDGRRPLALVRFDSKGNTEEALTMLRAALDGRIAFVMQGNSSAAAAALIDALDKHNQREPDRRAIFLNYSAVEPSLTNENCSFWHFRFDAHADMRLHALTEAVARALEGLRFDGAALEGLHTGVMRAGDHQLQQPLVVSVMERAGTDGVRHDVEGSGYGFKTMRRLTAGQVEMPNGCRMIRPD
jgi:hypothetical protein